MRHASRSQHQQKLVKSCLFKRICVGLYIVGGLLIIGAVLFYVVNRNQTVIDQAIIEDASFPVYVPRSAPEGYRVDDEKTRLSGSVLNYTFSSTTAERDIVVTVQPLPGTFDMQQLIGSGTVTSSSTSNGTLYDLSADGKSQYMLHAGDVLIFFTSNSVIDIATINSLASDLSRYE